MSTSTATKAEQKLAVIVVSAFNDAHKQAEHQAFGNTVYVELPTFTSEITREMIEDGLKKFKSTSVKFDGITLGEDPKATFICIA